MIMKLKDIFLNFFGVFYITIAIIAFYDSIINKGLSSVLWFSYTVFLFIGLGILFRSSYLIGSQLNIILFPYILWSIDFIYRLFSKDSLLGITDYIFLSRPFISQIISLQHLIIIPISLISLYSIKFKRTNFWIFSIIQIIFFFILTRIFSSPSENINCVFRNCLIFNIPSSIYIFLWFIGYFLMIFLANFFLINIKYLNYKHLKK